MNLPSEGIQPFEHLVYCDMGVFISKITSYEERRLTEQKWPKFGYLPKMAMSSKGSIAALLVSSFCERINSVAAMTITKDNSLLGSAEINMLVKLRMTKKFLEFMKTHLRKELTECVFEKFDICPDFTVTFEDNINPQNSCFAFNI